MITAYLAWLETFHDYRPDGVYFVGFILDASLIASWCYFIVMAANHLFM